MIKNCAICESEFDTKNRHNSQAVTCSATCFKRHRSKYIRDYRKKWERQNAEHRLSYQEQWRQKNLGKFAAKERLRRARKRNASGRHTAEQIQEMLIAQKYKCVNCGGSLKRKYHADHIMPLALGGSNDISNIQLLCVRCNLTKGTKRPTEWAAENGRLL